MLRNPRVLVSALLFVVAITGYLWWRRRMAAPPQPVGPQTERVLIAKTTILPRMVIDDTMVEERDIPIEEWNALSKEEQQVTLRKKDEALGRVALRTIPRGEMVRERDLSMYKGLVAKIPLGMRAMVFPIGDPPNPYHNRLIQVGDRVDIVATFNDRYSRVLLEDVEVLAIDDNLMRNPPPPPPPKEEGKEGAKAAQAPPPPAPSITIAVTPEQAERVAVALSNKADFDILVRPLEIPLPGAVEVASVSAPPASKGTTLESIAPLSLRDPEQYRMQQEEERRRREEERRQRLEERRAVAPPVDVNLITQRVIEAVDRRVEQRLEVLRKPVMIEGSPAPPREPAAAPKPQVVLIRGSQVETIPIGPGSARSTRE